MKTHDSDSDRPGRTADDPAALEALLTEAAQRLERGDVDAAERAVNEALELAPERGAVHLLHAEVLLVHGKREQALRSYRAAAEQGEDLPVHRWSALVTGWLETAALRSDATSDSATLQDLAPLLGSLHRLAERYPDDADVYMIRGELFWSRSEWRLASDEFGWASEIDESRVDPLVRHADCQVALGDWEWAADLLANAVENEPDDAALQESLGDALLMIGDGPRAVLAFEEALDIEPGRTGALLGRARASLSMDLAPDAIDDASRVIRASPGHPEALEIMAAAHLQRGAPDDASSVLDELLEAHPDRVEGLRLHAEADNALQRWDDADTAYQRILELQPHDLDSQLAWIESLLERGATDRAANHASRLADRAEGRDHFEALELLAHARRASGDHPGAMDTLNRALAGAEDGEIAAPFYLMRAKLHLSAGRPNLAWRDARWAIDCDRNLAEAYAVRGELAMELEGLDEALADFDAAIDLDPGSVRALAWRGRTRWMAGDREGATDDWDKAEHMMPAEDPLRAIIDGWRRDSD